MSQLNTKQAFLSHLINNLPAGLTTADVAFENKKFKPKNKDLWLAVYYIPATSDMMGKSTTDRDEERGLYQVSVFVSLNNDNYDNTQLQAIDELKSAFSYNTELVYNDQVISILDSETNAGVESEAWFQRDLTINFLTFTNRG